MTKHKYEDMENSIQNSAESIDDFTQLEYQQAEFNPQVINTPGPGDEDEEEEEEEQEEEVEEEDKGEDADNPPHDPKIVHSPVTTQPGGSPKRS